MERKIFLENLPKHDRGTNKGKINWKGSVGYKTQFIYDDIKDKIEIIDYNIKTRKLIIKYKDRIFYDKPISTGHFQNCVLGYYLGLNTNEFKIEVGQVFKDDKRDLVIIDREYKTSKRNQKFKYYKCICNICNWTEGWIEESDLLKQKVGCSCCNGKAVVPEINSIWAKAPWMMRWISEEDAKRYMPNSNKKIIFICDNCGKEKEMRISDVYKRESIGCKRCSDGLSYSEKFMISVLSQLNIKFETQYSQKWSEGKLYDFYLPNCNTIIETHGMQHYEYTGFGRTLEEEQENDRLKYELALKNGVDKYISIDCRKSELEWIKNSVVNSELSKIFEINKVDFEICNEFATNNLVKIASKMWREKKEYESINSIAESLSLSKPTVIKYLKLGNDLGWCEYNPKEEMGSKRCKAFDSNGDIICDEYSAREVARKMTELYGDKFDYRLISLVCNGKRNHHRGFVFKYE